jgi:hypothetical protein
MSESRFISFYSVHGPDIRSRRATWSGPTRRVLITGLTRDFVENCPLIGAELPPEAEIFELSDAGDRSGYVFTVRADWKP